MSSFSINPAALINAISSLPSPTPRIEEVGFIEQITGGVATVRGLPNAMANEVVETQHGFKALVLDLAPDKLGVALLGDPNAIAPGQAIRRTRDVLGIPTGEAMLGRVVDALGRPLDRLGKILSDVAPIEADSPQILQRLPVSRPLSTGLTVIDAAIPIGLGQRQLIVGDRQTGKTSLALDTLLNQKDNSVLSIYCAIGQRGDAVARVIGALRDQNAMHNTVVVVAGDEEPPGLAYSAPYAAMTIAESLAAQAKDVLIVFDDLTHHARAYREMSLLLRRPPGREAFPGDIFYLHARLLERAGQFGSSHGGGSITALPIVETQAENLSAYIPTNLISITDGQLYLSPRLVRKNQFPAIDLGVSVSRVGSKAQSPAYSGIAGNLRVTMSQFEELEEFARFGTRLDDATRAKLDRGSAVRAVLRQPERQPRSPLMQLVLLTGALQGVFDALDESELTVLFNQASHLIEHTDTRSLQTHLEKGLPLSNAEHKQFLDLAENLKLASKKDAQTNKIPPQTTGDRTNAYSNHDNKMNTDLP